MTTPLHIVNAELQRLLDAAEAIKNGTYETLSITNNPDGTRTTLIKVKGEEVTLTYSKSEAS